VNVWFATNDECMVSVGLGLMSEEKKSSGSGEGARREIKGRILDFCELHSVAAKRRITTEAQRRREDDAVYGRVPAPAPCGAEASEWRCGEWDGGKKMRKSAGWV
jgi:hypothetical protein